MFYGIVDIETSDPVQCLNLEEVQDIKDIIRDALNEKGYECDVDTMFETSECDSKEEKKEEEKERRLIDANHIDWNGMLCVGPFRESVEFLLDNQKEIAREWILPKQCRGCDSRYGSGACFLCSFW